MTPQHHLRTTVALMWHAQGVMQAATTHLEEYRKGSAAKFKDKHEEGLLLDRLTDLFISAEHVLRKKYNFDENGIAVMQHIGMEMREVFHRMLSETNPQKLLTLFTVIRAAVADEVRVVDDCMEAVAYTATLPDGHVATITKGADGLWGTPELAARYTEPALCLGGLEQLHNARQ